MYLEDGQCATCGKKLEPSTIHAPHNVALNELAKRFQFRPRFCSQGCIDRHIIQPALDETTETNESISLDYHRTKHKNDLTYANDHLQTALRNLEAEYREALKRNDDISEGLERARQRTDDEDTLRDAAQFLRQRKRERDAAASSKYDADKSEAKRAYEQAKREADDEFELKKRENSQHLARCLATSRESSVVAFFSAHDEAKLREKAEQPPAPEITDKLRFEHTHVLGPSGSGKTTLIKEIATKDFGNSNLATVIIDPKGFMVDQLSRYELFSHFPDRVVIIDPLADPPPPLNLFNIKGSPRLINKAVENFDYIFSQAKQPLTTKMRPVFRFCARLMFSIPGADIFTLMDFLESERGDPRFAPYIEQLTDIGAKRFFSADFYSAKLYGETRQQVKSRLNDILSMPEILAAFTSKSPPLDMVKCLDEGKIVLVNTRSTEIDQDASQLLGRYIIALTISAAFALGREAPGAHLFIDEFQDFVDEEATPRHLRLAREYKLGILCAHQNMFCRELNDSLRTAIATNTRIKYCSDPSGDDRNFMAKELGCNPSFLDKHTVTKTHANFATLVKGYPPFSTQVPLGNISDGMLMDDEDYEVLCHDSQEFLHPPKPKPLTVVVQKMAPKGPLKPVGSQQTSQSPPKKKDDSDFSTER